INSMATVRRFVPASIGDEFSDSKAISSDWSYVSEPVGISSNDAFNRPGLLEQINTRADHSDYLWYSTRYEISYFDLCKGVETC
ncbi:beta-galactosidase 8, partial [Tanacetum coccineum]